MGNKSLTDLTGNLELTRPFVSQGYNQLTRKWWGPCNACHKYNTQNIKDKNMNILL